MCRFNTADLFVLGSLNHSGDSILNIASDIRAVAKSVHCSISLCFLYCGAKDVNTKHLPNS